jgi:periplasmic copper chaperone A
MGVAVLPRQRSTGELVTYPANSFSPEEGEPAAVRSGRWSDKRSTAVASRLPRALAVVLATVVAVLAAGTGTAAAHVSARSSDAAPGGHGEVTFRVPNESDAAATTTLRIKLPADTPLASVRTQPVPGWTATLTTGTIDPPIDVHGTPVTEITWTADEGAGIKPGEYQTFAISGGPFPEVDALAFPTIQTYDDGSESAWIEPTVAGQAEPEHPAPTLALSGDGSTGAHGATPAGPAVATAGSDAAAPGASGLTVTVLVVGIAGLLAGLAGLGLALSARRRNTAA